MPVFYVDNYKGFTDTYIPLRRVNFLVGENNSGKTTVISLINLLIEKNFFFSQHIRNNAPELGSFDECISKTSANQQSFRFAVLSNQLNEQHTGEIGALLLHFENKNNAPQITAFSYIADNLNVDVQLFPETKYKYQQIDEQKLPKDSAEKKSFFRNWIAEKSVTGTFTKVKQYAFLRNKTLYAIKFTINKEINTKLGIKKQPIYRNHILDFQLHRIASDRAQPKRTYSRAEIKETPKGEHLPLLLYNLLHTIPEEVEKQKTILENFGKKSGLFDAVQIENLNHDKKQQAPLKVSIIVDNQVYNLPNVGYGVSQVLPVVAEVLHAKTNEWLTIQQPEVYLHAKARAAFGEFIFDAHTTHGINFIIETHSHYMINSYRFCMKEAGTSFSDAQILYFERDLSCNVLYCMPISPVGKYADELPEKFLQFFKQEQIKTSTI